MSTSQPSRDWGYHVIFRWLGKSNVVATQLTSRFPNVESEAYPIKKVAMTIDTSRSHANTSCSCSEKVPTNMKIAVHRFVRDMKESCPSFKRAVHLSSSKNKSLLLYTCHLIFRSIVSAIVCTLPVCMKKSTERVKVNLAGRIYFQTRRGAQLA